MTAFGTSAISEDTSKDPRVDVSREQFEACAVAAGWEGETIHRFLQPAFWQQPKMDHVHVGRRWLRITDWPLVKMAGAFRH